MRAMFLLSCLKCVEKDIKAVRSASEALAKKLWWLLLCKRTTVVECGDVIQISEDAAGRPDISHARTCMIR